MVGPIELTELILNIHAVLSQLLLEEEPSLDLAPELDLQVFFVLDLTKGLEREAFLSLYLLLLPFGASDVDGFDSCVEEFIDLDLGLASCLALGLESCALGGGEGGFGFVLFEPG